ncbi:zinc-binding alcohol dehydrogenase family protein [Luteolibacter sp. GHJ8]|uniref:Zinc-type alcohol dehydrogenase-like protein n=1 Tax=Luteolibacter rhizosphaerae TaxID=2989719 RepID=A0ABT3G999_9BACT|nr:zinc-binding alcohol dehydrogenase family protein [Luteolibacter rhizosphaerae]MCW1916414.1 zinc-binding alcohol dehydrogenase family protein [Luteolibacter rhizosphaerae]
MKAVATTRKLPLEDPSCFVTLDLPDPQPGPRDLVIRVKAIGINPVDYKVRRSRIEGDSEPKILGYDGAGIVEAVGSEVTLFRPGDEVFYAGDITRPGSNAELQLVDERIVAKKPESLGFPEAAALPLTAITAWECLFDRLGLTPGDLDEGKGKTLLILSGAGGVGSIGIQLAAVLTGFTIIATASRPETVAWCHKMGAHHVINHSGDWPAELGKIGFKHVDYIACFGDTTAHWKAMAEAIVPQGKITAIVESPEVPDIGLLKSKSAAFIWEFMFTRSMFQTPDMIEQHELLKEVATLVDAGRIRSTITSHGGTLSPETLAAAHREQEAGRMIGKQVLEVAW